MVSTNLANMRYVKHRWTFGRHFSEVQLIFLLHIIFVTIMSLAILAFLNTHCLSCALWSTLQLDDGKGEAGPPH